jgi:hypothetical protein
MEESSVIGSNDLAVGTVPQTRWNKPDSLFGKSMLEIVMVGGDQAQRRVACFR